MEINKIELIENLIESSEKISYENKEEFDGLERRAKMIISKIFGNDSHYVNDIEKIMYGPSFKIGGVQYDYEDYFISGLKQFKSILSVMLEDVKLSSNYADEETKPKTEIKTTKKALQIKEIRVLIASPSDVQTARELLLDKLETKFRREGYEEKCGKRIVVDGWEHLASQNGYAQDIVNEKLLSKADIVIAVFKHKLGSPTLNLKDNTERAPSGTAEELLYAIRETKDNTKTLGMAYFSNKAPIISLDSIDFDQTKEQWNKLKTFKKKIGTKILYKGYNAEEEILEIVCPDLCQNINDYFK